ncbi:hypothetical protein DMA11_24305 [Marinilabiliaceae bacterium JC017]|nr:hypothetical protein DMA11_24305 [Marinilabiliaceae bacterium JC017]
MHSGGIFVINWYNKREVVNQDQSLCLVIVSLIIGKMNIKKELLLPVERYTALYLFEYPVRRNRKNQRFRCWKNNLSCFLSYLLSVI